MLDMDRVSKTYEKHYVNLVLLIPRSSKHIEFLKTSLNFGLGCPIAAHNSTNSSKCLLSRVIPTMSEGYEVTTPSCTLYCLPISLTATVFYKVEILFSLTATLTLSVAPVSAAAPATGTNGRFVTAKVEHVKGYKNDIVRGGRYLMCRAQWEQTRWLRASAPTKRFFDEWASEHSSQLRGFCAWWLCWFGWCHHVAHGNRTQQLSERVFSKWEIRRIDSKENFRSNCSRICDALLHRKFLSIFRNNFPRQMINWEICERLLFSGQVYWVFYIVR